MATLTLQEIISSSANSAGTVKNRAQQIKAQARGLDSEQALTAAGDGLFNVQEQLDAVRKSIGGLAQFAVGISGLTIADIIAAGFRREYTTQVILIGAAQLLTFDDPIEEGDGLAYWVRQDGTGWGSTLNWDTNFKFALADGNDPTPDTVSIFNYRAFPDPDDSDVLKWFCTGYLLGNTI